MGRVVEGCLDEDSRSRLREVLRHRIVFVVFKPHLAHALWGVLVGARFYHYQLGLALDRRWRFFPVTLLKYWLSGLSGDVLIVESSVDAAEASRIRNRFKVVVSLAADPFFYRYNIYRGFKKIYYRIYRMYFINPSYFIAVSNLIKVFLTASGIPESKIFIAHPSAFIPSNIRNVHKKYILSATFVGNLHWVKGVDLLLDIFDIVRREYKDFEFYIIGDGILRNYLLLESKKRKFEKFKVVGKVSEEVKWRILSRTMFYVHAARFDPHPVSVIEGMGAGAVPIISIFTGTSDLVIEVSPRLIIRSYDPNEYARAILDLLSLPREELMYLSDISRRVAVSSICRSVNEFLNALHNIIINNL